jgi:hypothetical protein
MGDFQGLCLFTRGYVGAHHLLGDNRGTYVLTCLKNIKKDDKGSKNKVQSNGICRSLDADLSDLMFINQPSKKIEQYPTKRVTQHCSIQQNYNMLFMFAVTIAHLIFTYTIYHHYYCWFCCYIINYCCLLLLCTM